MAKKTKDNMLDNLHGAIRLPLKALIALTAVAAVLAFGIGTIWLVCIAAQWVYNTAAVWQVIKWVGIIGAVYVALLFGGAYVENEL